MSQNSESVSSVRLPLEDPSAIPDRIEAETLAMPLRWIRFATLGVGLLWGYFLLVLVYDETILGIHVGLRYLLPAIVASIGSLYWLGLWVYRRQLVSETQLKDLTVASIAVLLSIVAVDIGYSLYLNTINSIGVDWAEIDYERLSDQHVWIGEEFPAIYYPTEKNFELYKPDEAIGGDMYGEFYYTNLMESSTVVNSVLELRHISYSIDEHGFRETTPLEQAHIFALGDSFTFGWSISQDKTWVERLDWGARVQFGCQRLLTQTAVDASGVYASDGAGFHQDPAFAMDDLRRQRSRRFLRDLASRSDSGRRCLQEPLCGNHRGDAQLSSPHDQRAVRDQSAEDGPNHSCFASQGHQLSRSLLG